jgi:mycothiol synthase
MALPEGYRFRPARDEDAEAVAAFGNEESLAAIGAAVETAESLIEQWTAPSTDREHDVAVVEGPDGEVCGYLAVDSDPPHASVFALGMVALRHQGRGIGAAIVAENERRATRFLTLAAPGARVVVHAGTLAGEKRSTELLSARGYREVRRFALMRIDFEDEPPAPPLPPGIDLRHVRLATDAVPLYKAHREAFADHWGEGETSYEDFRHHLLEGPRFEPGLWFLAWEGEVVAGYVGARLESDESPSRGHVPVLGVRRPFRRRGIGEALLRQVFRELYLRGKVGCDLHVDTESLTGATRLYERVGMVAHPRFAAWEKELRPGRSP